MSLSSFIKVPRVREKLSEAFPCPRFKVESEMLVPPRSKRYALVGTAFDYLLRFFLEDLNPVTVTSQWVAEGAIDKLDPLDDDDRTYLKIARKIIDSAKSHLTASLRSKAITDSLLMSSLLLAQIDPLRRAGYRDPNLGVVHDEDIEELRSLIKIVDPGWFRAKKHCLLNPTFGDASAMVGGADADLIIDGTLIDIKTTKEPKLKKIDYHQLIGYLLLHRIGGADGLPANRRITDLAIYYSRYGQFFRVRKRDIASESRFEEITDWFHEEAERAPE